MPEEESSASNQRFRPRGPQCQECGHPGSGPHVEHPRPRGQSKHGYQVPRGLAEDMGDGEAIEGFRAS